MPNPLNAFLIVATIVLALIVSNTHGEEPWPPLSDSVSSGTLIVLGNRETFYLDCGSQSAAANPGEAAADKAMPHFDSKRTKGPVSRDALMSYALSRSGTQYYTLKNAGPIYSANVAKKPVQPKVFFQKTTQGPMWDIALDGDENLYFAEMQTGPDPLKKSRQVWGLADGRIYKMSTLSGGAATPELFCTIHPADLDVKSDITGGQMLFRKEYVDAWMGDFTFGRTESGAIDPNTLFVCTGYYPAGIFRLKRVGDQWSKPEQMFFNRGPVRGLLMVGPSECYFYGSANPPSKDEPLRIYRLIDWKELKPVLTPPKPDFGGGTTRKLAIAP